MLVNTFDVWCASVKGGEGMCRLHHGEGACERRPR